MTKGVRHCNYAFTELYRAESQPKTSHIVPLVLGYQKPISSI